VARAKQALLPALSSRSRKRRHGGAGRRRQGHEELCIDGGACGRRRSRWMPRPRLARSSWGDHVAPRPRPLWAERRRPDSMPGRHRVDRDRCAQIFLHQDTDGDAGHSARGAACQVRAASQSQRPLPRPDNKRRGWVSWTCPLEVILFWKLRADIRCQPNDGYRIGQIFL
jgi:hypothetical protein